MPARRWSFALLILALGAPGPLVAQQPSRAAPAAGTRATGATAAAAGDWVLPGKDVQGTRYSELNQITIDNVKNLKEVWSYTTGIKDGHEGQPVVVNNTMYVVTPFPNHLIAFDLTKPGPAKKWEYAPPIDIAAPGKACCDNVNRGAVYYDGKIIYNLLDNHTIAVDANTGKEVWRTKLGDVNKGETMTMAPLLVKDMVIVGNSGGEMGVRGWIAALDARTGKQRWKAFNTGPDADVKIGPDFKPFYPQYKQKDLGVSTWPTDQWKLGGGTVWGWITYDPELNLIYYGTSNPGVWNPDQRPGDNLWSTSVIARNPDNGQMRWAWQGTPHDEWDFDGVNESIPVDLEINGQARKALVRFDRNGYAVTLDRTTGEVLVAAPFQHINWSTGFDMKTGRPIMDQSKRTHQGRLTKNICPSSSGARDQQPAAFSPRTKLFYTPSHNVCMDYGGVEAQYIAGTPYVGAAVRMFPGPGGYRGEFMAWDAATGKKVWSIKDDFPLWGGALATAGDVVFYGTMTGDFKAVNAKTGDELWKTHFPSGIIGNPMTYVGPDGKQYVAVYSGVGGWMGAIVPGNLSPDDPWAALGATGAVPDLPKHTEPGGAVHVFALP
ncbi:MAG TPA: methanol/ethanol family PQQ-dependent dehydrogenase [Gemmatimonadaceae bacterium]|nr:methanol/ethanol family PQQ-dependent dehydrogenase [Gemmatimonadaceae bacterium]